MQGKGFITVIAIILGIICVSELFPTWYASSKEKQAREFAGGNAAKYQKELEKLSKDTLNLGYTKMYYSKAKEQEMKLGLDLKGGINVLLEINQRDLISNLTNNSTNPFLIKVLDRTDAAMRNSSASYIDTFFQQFDAENKAAGTNIKLADADIFGQKSLPEIKYNSTNEQVKAIIKDKINASIATAYTVIRARIDKLGVTQPNVKRVPGTGRILVEMPGITDVDRVKKILQTSAKLQFWEVHLANEFEPYFQQLASVASLKADSIGIPKGTNLLAILKKNPSFGAGIATISLSDTAVVNKVLKSKLAQDLRPANLKYAQLMYGYKPEDNMPNALVLYAIRGNAAKKAPVDGAVKESRVGFDNLGLPVVEMQMDSQGARDWKTMTEKNQGKPVAVTLDERVYSAPNVNEPIPNGQTRITGNFSQDEAQDLVNVLAAGKLPAGAKIVQADVVGPSLGKESINAGMYSFLIAFALIVAYIIFYYGGAGVFAVIAMIINLFYIFGIMDSFDATLTLPGIAGIVLSMAMAVDTNVIIYERTKEEIFKGKGIREAYKDGFKHALSAIIDGHTTTLLTAIVLWVFGTGPIQGFAVTLMIGIVMTFFTSVLLSRVMIFNRLNKGKTLSVWTPPTKNLFRNTWIGFIKKRKFAYVLSAILTALSIFSIATNSFKFGIDFTGGRSYIVKLNKTVDANTVKAILEPLFRTQDGKNSSVETKTFGTSDQIQVTTDYLINDESLAADQKVEQKLFEGLKPYLPANSNLSNFKSGAKNGLGIMSSTKVGPTVADDIAEGGTWAVLAALGGIFIYILVRFRRWEFSVGAVVGLFHDAIIILGVYSFFHRFLPFNMEVNQDFIAAILTVLGYSINDTVIVFDRIREYLREKKNIILSGLFDDSISSTLGRTFNTSFTTLLVITAIFIFGGENLRGFMFALFLGIAFGTYSSIFISSAIAYDLLKLSRKKGSAVPTEPEVGKKKLAKA